MGVISIQKLHSLDYLAAFQASSLCYFSFFGETTVSLKGYNSKHPWFSSLYCNYFPVYFYSTKASSPALNQQI